MTNRRLLLGMISLTVLAGACGKGSSTTPASATPDRSIAVTMSDNAFNPTTVAIKSGETVRFVFHNTGKADHEAILGDDMAQQDHEKSMNAKPMGGMHQGDDRGAITVKPGASGSITHTFKTGDTDLVIGCHEPGHYKAGMKLTLST